MSDPMKQAWSDVAEGFSVLGRLMKERYRAADADEVGDGAPATAEANDAGKSYGVHTNPKKSENVTFKEQDKLIVMAEN